MRTWRVCRAPYADLKGEGARLHGGRWNSPGRSMVYTAVSAALAVLEVRVRLDLSWDLLPDDYLLLEIDLDAVSREAVPTMPADTAAFGDRWLGEARSAILDVPSVVPEERNCLFNPAHPYAARISIATQRPLRFDERLWRAS